MYRFSPLFEIHSFPYLEPEFFEFFELIVSVLYLRFTQREVTVIEDIQLMFQSSI